MRSRQIIMALSAILAVLGVFVLTAALLYGQCPAGCNKACCLDKGRSAPVEKTDPADIDTPALKALISAKVPMALLDARGPQKSWIPGAKPMAVNVKDDVILKAVPSKDALVITYCGGVQCPLSTMLGKRLRDLGYRNVLEYRKGIRGWIASGGEVQNAGS